MQVSELELLLKTSSSSSPKVINRFVLWKPSQNKKELRLFANSLCTLLTGGVPLLKALHVIGVETQNRKFKDMVFGIEESVRDGLDFSSSLEERSAQFPPFFSQMIRAGEVSGSLPEVLKTLVMHLKKAEESHRKIIEAITYPCFVLMTGIVTLVVLLKVVLPKIVKIYDDLNGELPALTQAVLALADAIFPILFFSVIMIGLLFMLARRHQSAMYAILFRTPLFGRLIKKILLQQTFSMLSLLLRSGVSLLESMECTARTLPYVSIQKNLFQVKENLAQGTSVTESFRHLPWLDSSTTALIFAAEESGRMPEVFQQIAEEAAQELETETQMLIKLLEPLMILIVGLIVGFIVISAILPIFEMNEWMR
jgi:type II secretory pathway component PulF